MSETTIRVIAHASLVALIASSFAAIMLTLFGIWSFQRLRTRYSNRIIHFAFQFFGLIAIFILTVFTSLYAFDRIYVAYFMKLMELSTDSSAFISTKYGFVPLFDAGSRSEINFINAGIIFLICAFSFLKNWRSKRIQRNLGQ